MIASFADQKTQDLHRDRFVRSVGTDLGRHARRKLLMLDAATNLQDLRSPPGNRLEKLSGDRRGQWSIRVNDQWRICFAWQDNAAHDVQLVDYH